MSSRTASGRASLRYDFWFCFRSGHSRPGRAAPTVPANAALLRSKQDWPCASRLFIAGNDWVKFERQSDRQIQSPSRLLLQITFTSVMSLAQSLGLSLLPAERQPQSWQAGRALLCHKM